MSPPAILDPGALACCHGAVRYASVEGALRATVWLDLPAYRVADAASQALLWVVERAGFDPDEGSDPPPATYHRAKALLYLGVLALRATRAAMSVIAAGYEGESMTYKRTLMEVHS